MIPVNMNIENSISHAKFDSRETSDGQPEKAVPRFICGGRLGDRLRWLRRGRIVARVRLVATPGRERTYARTELQLRQRILVRKRASVCEQGLPRAPRRSAWGPPRAAR